MSESSTPEDTLDRRTAQVPKQRSCLRCDKPFQSEWSGERICSRCKSSSAWRGGLPMQKLTSGGSR